MTDDDMSLAERKGNSLTPGEDLDHFSLDDLQERKRVLEAEIRRVDQIAAKKQAAGAAADAVFKI